MANKNRADNKSGYLALTNRTSPYDAEPLIQKADQQTTLGDDFMDSAIMRIPTIGSINNPSVAFNVDFDFDGGRDRYDIDTTGSADAAFTITLAGLNDNETGILNITKKANDTFTFGNGLITPFNNTEGQEGQTSIVLFVKVVSSNYIVNIGYENKAVLVDNNSPSLKTKIIEIGNWNMFTDITKNVPHGISGFTRIRGLSVFILSDGGGMYPLETSLTPSGFSSSLLRSGAVEDVDNTNIILRRQSPPNGFFF